MDDFRRVPRNRVAPSGMGTARPVPPLSPPRAAAPPPPSFASPRPVSDNSTPLPSPLPIDAHPEKPKKRTRKKIIFGSLLVLIVGFLLSFAGSAAWYYVQLQPVNAQGTTKQDVTIVKDSTPRQIAAQLQEAHLIKNSQVFLWYAKMNGVVNKLQAGTYKLSQSLSTPEIATKLSSGTVDTFSITFLPGATVTENKKVFTDLGYSSDEVNAAFAKTYSSALFSGKPASADLEGYIYGETYSFVSGTSVAAILEHTFSVYLAVVNDNNLVSQFAARGLSLYQGITLASIVQREASAQGDDMAKIAQVFYKRLATNMPLGSDVTYQYIADKTGVARDPNLDSPYNTRIKTGLPPGPIATPGKKALLAVASPANTDYLYFLSGDDNVTYFSKTLEEHEANAKNHCQQKCQIL